MHKKELEKWILGIIESKGSFAIIKNKGGYRCEFSLYLRADYVRIIILIAEEIGAGYLVYKNGNFPKVGWRVISKQDCIKLDEFLDKHYMMSLKNIDYQIWHEALSLWKMNGRGTKKNWLPMKELHDELVKKPDYLYNEEIEGATKALIDRFNTKS